MVWKFNIYIVHLKGLGFLASGIHSISIKLKYGHSKSDILIWELSSPPPPPVHSDINMQQGHDNGSAMYCYI